ncbi:hypothetical protein O3G_MSEX006689 [Manduca sexta]|uniref:Nudix hydrolase domain-containing protein n=1 Tax=Manduca sexta TaxID=7130 RepID=A0A921Z5M5_MANSE|nr:hypothetical protein O3G_MSEX006689 [Manduca sexta]
MYGKITFGIHNIFSFASRERCMTKLKKISFSKQNPKLEATAAVLVPLCRVEGVPSLLYTVRSSTLRTNSGQVSFPGGKTDKNETAIETAIRETREEIGLSPQKIEVWGEGSPVPGRNFKIMITPVVASIQELKPQDLKVNTNEVSEVFTVPIETLCDSKNQYYTQFKNGYILPVFVAEEYKIWGVTAYITHLFLSGILSKDVYKNEWIKKKIVIDNL